MSLSLWLSLSLSLYATNLCIFHLALPCLDLPCLVLSCAEWTSITIVIIGMTLYELVLHYHMLSYLFCWFLHYCILFQIGSIEFDLLFIIVSHINLWFVSICPSVCLSVSLSVWISICFLFSFFSLSFLSSFLFLHSFFSLFSWTSYSHTHTHAHTRTHTYIWIYVSSYDTCILLQKLVSEESYSSDCIISYLFLLVNWYYNYTITMKLSSCHHCSLNNDCHYMQRIYVHFISTCLVLCWLILILLLFVWRCMSLSYIIILHLIISSFILSLLLICSQFYSTLI